MLGKINKIIILNVLLCFEYGCAMQMGLSHRNVDPGVTSNFDFIGKNPILNNIVDKTCEVGIWGIVSESDERIESFLNDADISEDEISTIENKDEKKLELAFFGNETLCREFSIIKGLTSNFTNCSEIQKNQLNWLILNFRGDYECAKILTSFYKFRKEKPLHLFWRHVACCFNLAVGDSYLDVF